MSELDATYRRVVERVEVIVRAWQQWEEDRKFEPHGVGEFARGYVRGLLADAFKRPWETEPRGLAGADLDEHDRLLLEGWSRWLSTEGVRLSQKGTLPGTTFLLEAVEVDDLAKRFIGGLNGEG